MDKHFQYLDPHTKPEDVFGLKIIHDPSFEGSHPHDHNFCEFTLIVEGTLLHMANGSSQLLTPHTLNFVRADDIHFYKNYDNNPTCKYNVGIPNDILMQAFNFYRIDPQLLFSPKMPIAVHLSQKEFYNLYEKLEKLQNSDFDTAHGILFISIVSDVLYLLLQSGKEAIDFTKIPDWFNELLFALELPENYSVGIEKLKTLSHYSVEHINRCFKKYLNTTPTEYINRLRIEHAAKLLIEKSDNILNIGYLVGFKNEGYFYKRFKEYYHMTPNEFAKTYRK